MPMAPRASRADMSAAGRLRGVSGAGVPLTGRAPESRDIQPLYALAAAPTRAPTTRRRHDGRVRARRLRRSVEPQDAAGVGAIHLLEHVVGQEDAVDLPAALCRRGEVVEILVAGLEEPEIRLVGADARRAVDAEHDAVGVLQEEVAGRVRLPAELGEPGADLDVHVRVLVEPARHLG